jgi:predicted phosphodiesterase
MAEEIILCHGAPYDEDAYLIDATSVDESYRCLDKKHPKARFCLFGHTHIPTLVVRRSTHARPQLLQWSETINLASGGVYLINPGSVGQPRDGIELASFGILDTDSMNYRNLRAHYDVKKTQRKVLDAGLPPELAQRLAEGR